ncbi:MAG: hypothetical protein ACRD0S_13625, partial [Acidimicrobiales bacterium]
MAALAHHFARAAPGGDPAKAVDYATRAGDRALALLAHDEAVSYYTQALELLDLPGVVPDEARRCDLLISLGEAQRRAGERAHRRTLLDAARLAQTRGDADGLARAALANNRGIFSVSDAVDAERVAVLEAALDSLGPGSGALRPQLLATLASELTFSPDYDRRCALGAEAVAAARRLGDPATLARVLALIQVPLWTPAAR